jgi:hypothetical protein
MENPFANWKLYHSSNNKQWDPALVSLTKDQLTLNLKDGERSIDLADLTISHTKYWESGKSTIHLVEKGKRHILLGGEIEVITSLFFNIQRLLTNHENIGDFHGTELQRGTDFPLLIEDLVNAVYINNELKEAQKLLDSIGDKIGKTISEKYDQTDLKDVIEIITREVSICEFKFHSLKRSDNHAVAYLSLERCLMGDIDFKADCYKKIQCLLVRIFKSAIAGMADRDSVNVIISKSPALNTCYIKIHIHPREEVLILDSDNS